MNTSYHTIKAKFPYVTFLMFVLAMVLLIPSCSNDDLEEVEEEEVRQDAQISFEPDFFGQSFTSAPDSTHNFTVTIAKGQKEASSLQVYEKIMSEGVVVKESTELSAYSRQLEGSETEMINVEYHVPAERQNNDQITLNFVVTQEDDEVSEALVVEVEVEEPEEDLVQEINDIIYFTQLAVGGQDNTETGSFFNIENTENFTLPEASSNQAEVDFAMLVGASTGINFIVPASGGMQYFGSELEDAIYNGWDIKNDGEFVNIGNLGDSDDIFEGLEHAVDIAEAFDDARTGVTDIPGYVANENGPGDRIRQVNVGDIIFFRSESGTIAVLKITSVLPDTAGLVEFEMKTAAEPDAVPEEPEEEVGEGLSYAEGIEIGGQSNETVGNYFSLLDQTIYDLDEATENQEKVNIAMLVGASTGVNFLVPASSGFQYFGSTITEETVFGWDTRNDGTFTNVGNSDELVSFEDITSGEELVAAFDTAQSGVENMTGYVANENGPGDRIRQVKVGDVIFFQGEDGTLAVMKIEQLATSTSGSVIFNLKTQE